jgi:parvulin-like peptidyl-prolyl isomerase
MGNSQQNSGETVGRARHSGWVAGFARRTGLPVAGVALAAGLALAAGGCGTNSQVLRPLTAESFAAPPSESRGIGNPLDRPGPVNYDQVRLVGPAPDGSGNGGAANGNGNIDPTGAAGRAISKTLEQTIRPTTVTLERPPATGPVEIPEREATGPATLPAEGGRFDFVGFVVMQVNGQPIYIDNVIKSIEKALAVEAKHQTPAGFRRAAQFFLDRELKVFEAEELEFAMAQRSLLPADEVMARAMTTAWRQNQITVAGGSLELAKRKAADDGWDFEDLAKRQYRFEMIRLYYRKRLLPQVFVPRRDMWDFYVANKDTLFTTHGQARFRVIKIDPRAHAGGKDDAYAKAREVISRATQEKEDFAALARSSFNDDPVWRQSGGYLTPDGWVKENALRLAELEHAAWKLQPGQVSDIVPIEGAFYVVKLEEAKPGKVDSFEDAAVQGKIFQKLQSQQIMALREKEYLRLRGEAVIRENQGMKDLALDMLMRKYPQWASAK